MASHGDDANAAKLAASEDQEEKKTAVSFGFTKTVSKFKPSTGDSAVNKDDRDYLTGIDRNKLQR